MTFESILRMINRRTAEVYKYFGEQSTEYHKIKNAIYMQKDIIDLTSITKTAPGKPVQFVRSKKVVQAAIDNPILGEELTDIWNYMKSLGTVKQMAEEYYASVAPSIKQATGEKPNWKEHKSFIQDAATRDYRGKYYDRDLYEEIGDEIAAQEELIGTEEFDRKYFDELVEIYSWFKRTGKGIRRQKYDEIGDAFENAKRKHEERMRDIISNLNKKDAYDMGSN